MREAEFAQRIEETMDLLGLRWHHETDSRRSKEGFPDYCIVGPHGILFLEIKSDTGKATPEQEAWVAALTQANEGRGFYTDEMAPVVTAYVAWPKDWDRVLSDLKRIAGRTVRVHVQPPAETAAEVARAVIKDLQRPRRRRR